MSGIFISLLLVLDLLGFSTAQKGLENLSQKVGVSDPFDVGTIESQKTDVFDTVEGADSKNTVSDNSLNNFPIGDIKSFPEGISKQKPSITADAAYVYDLASGKVLFSKNPEKIRPIASVTKVMTALVVLENCKLNEVVTVSPAAAWISGSKMHLYPGERITVKELVSGMLIASGNDAARALQDYYGKDKLVQLMNDKADWLGLTETHYVEVTGLDLKDHSSVKDLAILSGYALRNTQFRQIVDIKTYTAVSKDGRIQHPISTTNRLLKNYPDIFGLKTGYTEEAGNCLIAGSREHGHSLIAIVLGVPDGDVRFSEARELLDWAVSAYKW